MSENTWNRRRFIHASALIVPAFAATSTLGLSTGQPAKEKEEIEVTPTEDLMREHGLLNRCLLVYDHYLALIAGKKELPSQPLSDTAGIIRRFIEEYHEKQEEDFVFPRFEKAHKLTELVATLRAQHKAGRQVTAQVLRLASATALKQPADRERLAQGLRAFLRMYRPHEAREDTVLFPALHEIVSKHEYDAMGEDFEKREHQMFGEAGFEGMVEKIGGIEKQIGIYELAQFTPRP